MEINDEQEIAIVNTVRLIRQFNESIGELEKMGAIGSANESARMRDKLIDELRLMTSHLAQITVPA